MGLRDRLKDGLVKLLLGIDIEEISKMQRQNEFWAEKVEKVSKDQEKLLMTSYKMREKLFEAQKIAKIGRVALESSQLGVLVVDKRHNVINVNERACEYLGQTIEDVIGKTVDQLSPESAEAAKYINFFFRQSERARNIGKALPERTFTSEENQFSMQGFYEVNAERDFDGGYLFIVPNKLVKNVRRAVVAPVEALTRQTIVTYAEQLMAQSKTKVVDLATSSANMEALGQLFNYYTCFNNGRFIFQNVSRFERDYLVNLGVDEKDIISVRHEPNARPETGQYPAVSPNGV